MHYRVDDVSSFMALL